jgi:hypothetical protein
MKVDYFVVITKTDRNDIRLIAISQSNSADRHSIEDGFYFGEIDDFTVFSSRISYYRLTIRFGEKQVRPVYRVLSGV